MDISTQVVPAAIILVANLLSGKHGSLQWETVTAIFGWAACISLVSSVVLYVSSVNYFVRSATIRMSGFW